MKIFIPTILLSLFLLTGCEIPLIQREETSPIVPLYVGPEMVECDNPLSNNLCFQIKTTPDEPWQLYKGNIMGLQYEPGFMYELQVQKDSLSKSSPISPEQQWVLIKIVQKVSMNIENISINKDLVGKVWNLTEFGSPDALRTAIGENVPNLFFHEDGHFTGDTGCNRFNGSFQFSPEKIIFSAIASTKMMCAGESGKLEQEQTILKTLENAGMYQLENGSLTILSSDGNMVLFYKQQ